MSRIKGEKMMIVTVFVPEMKNEKWHAISDIQFLSCPMANLGNRHLRAILVETSKTQNLLILNRTNALNENVALRKY